MAETERNVPSVLEIPLEQRREQADRERFRRILKREGGQPQRPDDVD